MSYLVVLTPRAKHNLRTIHTYIYKHAPHAADDWLDRAERAVDSLGHHPERCPLAPESLSFAKPIRQLLFGAGNRGTYRFLFVVLGESVYVLHVRHGSMLPLSPGE
ncbi:MAG: type II toxin-antitoxin system RelE/ParE family toxin [Terriglobales bacterium]